MFNVRITDANLLSQKFQIQNVGFYVLLMTHLRDSENSCPITLIIYQK